MPQTTTLSPDKDSRLFPHFSTGFKSPYVHRKSRLRRKNLGRRRQRERERERDARRRVFIDRDGVLFRYILDFLREGRLVLPENFSEVRRLKMEAVYYRLKDMAKSLRLKDQDDDEDDEDGDKKAKGNRGGTV
ncbi:hypothetical protein J437_LFUL007529 [Ladona fulva]|uniref:Potassium channel tetramerisation-type BTB domain-containing protein n=1 Tax=Ladona fulva TaxID=123851 RepID=A0A8K0K4W9_LADFU|nr:hypothetical protein J437_LFUL007529 [Ladona fulva]